MIWSSWLAAGADAVAIVQGLVLIAATILGGLWAYSKFVVERGLLPHCELALVQFRLQHVREPHTIERAFAVGER